MRLKDKMKLLNRGMPLTEEALQHLCQQESEETNRQAVEWEKHAILRWFEEYDAKIAECNRCQRLGKDCHHNMIELDIEAEQKRIKYKELSQNN